MNNIVVAIVGMCGSGKSTLAGFFVKEGYACIHFGDLSAREIVRRGLPANEASEKFVREELRREHGPAVYAKESLTQIKERMAASPVVLDGLYSWSEYKLLKREFGKSLIVLAVAANLDIRKERLEKRAIRPLSPQEAESRDAAEIENLEKGGPIAAADYYIVNNSTPEILQTQFEEFLKWTKSKS